MMSQYLVIDTIAAVVPLFQPVCQVQLSNVPVKIARTPPANAMPMGASTAPYS